MAHPADENKKKSSKNGGFQRGFLLAANKNNNNKTKKKKSSPIKKIIKPPEPPRTAAVMTKTTAATKGAGAVQEPMAAPKEATSSSSSPPPRKRTAPTSSSTLMSWTAVGSEPSSSEPEAAVGANGGLENEATKTKSFLILSDDDEDIDHDKTNNIKRKPTPSTAVGGGIASSLLHIGSAATDVNCDQVEDDGGGGNIGLFEVSTTRTTSKDTRSKLQQQRQRPLLEESNYYDLEVSSVNQQQHQQQVLGVSTLLYQEIAQTLWRLRQHSKHSNNNNNNSSVRAITDAFIRANLQPQQQQQQQQQLPNEAPQSSSSQLQNWTFCWETLLDSISSSSSASSATTTSAKKRNRKILPELQLSAALISHRRNLDSLLPFLLLSSGGEHRQCCPPTIVGDNRMARVRALSACTVIIYCVQPDIIQEQSPSYLIYLVEKVIPALLQITLQSAATATTTTSVTVGGGSSRTTMKRTVLGQRSMDAALEILATACDFVRLTYGTTDDDKDSPVLTFHKEHDCTENDAIVRATWATAPIIQQFWAVQQQWIRSANGMGRSNVNDGDNDNGGAGSCFSSLTREEQPPMHECNLSKIAVLADWNSLFDECCRCQKNELPCNDYDDVTDAKWESNGVSSWWCKELRGLNVEGVNTRVGGIRQTLLSYSAPPLSGKEILVCIQRASDFMCDTNETGNDAFVPQGGCRQRSLLRGVVAWFGKKRNSFQKLDEAIRTKIVELSIRLLRSNTPECIDLVLAILDICLSPDLNCTVELNAAVPAPFNCLLGVLMESSDSDASTTHGASSKAICSLVAQYICSRGKSLISELIAKCGLRHSTVEVLTIVACGRAEVVSRPAARLIVKDGDVSGLAEYASDLLLKNFWRTSCIQIKVKKNPQIFTRCSVEFLVPKVIDLLGEAKTKNTFPGCDAETIVESLVTALLSCGGTAPESIVPKLMEKLFRIEKMAEAPGENSDRTTVEQICGSIGGTWRRRFLLGTSQSDDNHAFERVLVSIGRQMFASPSHMAPLTLLGSVLGQDAEYIEGQEDGIVRQRVKNAVLGLLKLSLDELDVVAKEEMIGSLKENIVFRRLSPLLLLRRVPADYFWLARKQTGKIQTDAATFPELLTSLGDHLAARLDIESVVWSGKYTSDERRLAAEVAGRTMPMGTMHNFPKSCSSFHRICIPAFSIVAGDLRGDNLPVPKIVAHMRSARAALYTVCTFISSNNDEDHGRFLLNVASFALFVIGIDIEYSADSTANEELLQLQTGCINFFATCIENAVHRQILLSSERVLFPPNDPEESDDGNCNLSFATDQIFSELKTIICGGKSTTSWASSLAADFDFGLDPAFPLEVSVPARTCLLNAFLVVSQRCTFDDGKLKGFAEATLPWLLAWGASGTIDQSLRHPLCIASAMQVLFVLITRTKSLDCMVEEGGRNNTSVRRAYLWTVSTMKMVAFEESSYATHAVRSAALKLMLALVSVGVVNDGDGLSLGELEETFSFLQEMATKEHDPELQQFANQIICVLSRRAIDT